jgi:hypothetical protein
MGRRPVRKINPWLGALAVFLAPVLLGALLQGCGSGSGHRRVPRRTAPAPPAATTTTAPAPPAATTTTAPAPPAEAAAQPPPGTEAFGVNVNLLFNNRNYTPAQIDSQLQALHQTGATLARSDALWEWSEPAPPVNGVHTYDWSFDDAIAGSLAAHDLTWLPIIDYSALWDESIAGQDHSPPGSTSDYAAYAGAFAARYGPGGTFWQTHPNLTAEPVETYEIWNEPDSSLFWTPAPDPAQYADLYLAARAAITAVDPDARVIVGGLTQPTTFLPAMVAANPQLVGHIDGVAIHPYGEPSAILAKVRAARKTLVSLGMPSVPLYLTEFGWTTHPAGALDYVSAAHRPGDIRRTLTALGHLDCGVAAAILYTWVSPQGDPNNLEDWFGIHPPDGGTSPATVAFAAGLHAAQTPGKQLDDCPAG